MIVPQYWAEARHRGHVKGRQVTVRRFGWSDLDDQDAQTNAESRAREAFDRIAAGESLPRRERKVPYNSAEGVPIREEVVARYEPDVVSRSAYGARCLNTPDVLFADIDFEKEPGCWLNLIVLGPFLGGAAVLGWRFQSWFWGLVAAAMALILARITIGLLFRAISLLQGGEEQRAKARVAKYVSEHPECYFRVYRTPAGLRILAMHATFDPADPSTLALFNALGTDPVYQRMCQRQRCFRARVSPKPWRIGILDPLRPRPGVWPINPERMPEREQWIERYEQAAAGYSACRFLEAIGSGTVIRRTAVVQELHDDLCRACVDLPIA
jgi:hypothetical protein